MPVREALWQLESERAVVIETNRRIRVNTLSVPEVREVFQIRLLLESLAAEQSCDRRPDTALPAAKSLLKQTAAHLQTSAEKYIRANFAFHHLIYSYGASPVLMRHIDLLWARVGPYFYYMHLQKDVDLSDSQQYHQAMYDAWVARDKKKMVQSLRGDLTVLPMRFFPPEGEQDRQCSLSPKGCGVSATSVSGNFLDTLEVWQRGHRSSRVSLQSRQVRAGPRSREKP